jgi:hypothetical protein
MRVEEGAMRKRRAFDGQRQFWFWVCALCLALAGSSNAAQPATAEGVIEQYRLDPIPGALEKMCGVHPRIYLNRARVAELREAIKTAHAPLWEEVRELADRAVRSGPPAYRKDDGSSGDEQLWQRGVGNTMPHLAMAWALTGDPKYLDSAREWALASCGYETWGTLLVDGRGQLGEGGQWFNGSEPLRVKARPRVLRAVSTEKMDHVVGEASEAYPKELGVRRYVRHLLFVKPDVLIVVDDITRDKSGDLELRFHPEQDKADRDGDAFLAQSVFAEYTEPHVLAGGDRHVAARRPLESPTLDPSAIENVPGAGRSAFIAEIHVAHRAIGREMEHASWRGRPGLQTAGNGQQ